MHKYLQFTQNHYFNKFCPESSSLVTARACCSRLCRGTGARTRSPPRSRGCPRCRSCSGASTRPRVWTNHSRVWSCVGQSQLTWTRGRRSRSPRGSDTAPGSPRARSPGQLTCHVSRVTCAHLRDVQDLVLRPSLAPCPVPEVVLAGQMDLAVITRV